MANTIGFGQGAVNNTNGFGKAPTNNTIDFGEVCADSWSPETNLVGASGEIVTNGNFAYNRNTGTLEGYVFQDTVSFDTTVDNTLDICVQWAQAKTQDQINSHNFVLHKVY